MSTSVNLTNLVAELNAAQAVILPQIEGLHDFARLNLHPETLAAVNQAIVDFERRRDLQVAALAALANLSGDNYPDVPERAVIQDVYEDLKDNVSTIEAAFSKFEEIGQATTVTITAGTPTLKPVP